MWNFRRTFDPRLTEEYQTAGEPWTKQMAEGELAAMDIGASLWATANVAERSRLLDHQDHPHRMPLWLSQFEMEPESPMFDHAGASGLTVRNFQDVILVNQTGQRFWNEVDETYDFLNACLGTNGNLGRRREAQRRRTHLGHLRCRRRAARALGPAPAERRSERLVLRCRYHCRPGWQIANPYQLKPVPGRALEETVARYNSFVDAGKDAISRSPRRNTRSRSRLFTAAWSTPILHDCLTGLRINRNARSSTFTAN